MTTSSCLIKTRAPLILDTSVFINLNGSGACARILDALPNQVMMTLHAVGELIPAPDRSRDDRTDVESHISSARIEVISLNETASERFGELISDSTSPLGDGEAATIAAAEMLGAMAVVDERRARRFLLAERIATSIDIFSHPEVMSALGVDGHKEALYQALRRSRMSVHESQRDWVINVIGPARAAECNSLPRHKQLRGA